MSPASNAGLGYERIPFVNVLKSAYNGPKSAVQAAIKDAEQYQTLLGDILKPLPQVDFTREQLFLVAAGEQTSNRFDVTITSVLNLSDRGQNRPDLSLVYFEEEDTGGLLDVITAPWHLVKTQRLEGDTQFDKTAAISH
jgi:hypothetical protein